MCHQGGGTATARVGAHRASTGKRRAVAAAYSHRVRRHRPPAYGPHSMGSRASDAVGDHNLQVQARDGLRRPSGQGCSTTASAPAKAAATAAHNGVSDGTRQPSITSPTMPPHSVDCLVRTTTGLAEPGAEPAGHPGNRHDRTARRKNTPPRPDLTRSTDARHSAHRTKTVVVRTGPPSSRHTGPS
jgi:hypothetical protein